MQIKSKINFIITFLLIQFFVGLNVYANEFDITAKEIIIDKDNKVLVGVGGVKATDQEGKIIYADKITYKEKSKFLLAEGNVKVKDIDGNNLTSNKLSYDKINEIIKTFGDTDVFIQDGYKAKSKNVTYNIIDRLISSNNSTIFTDVDNNTVETNMFNYHVKNNLFSSIGKIKVKDINNNKYFFKEMHIDTKKHEMIGSDVSVVLDEKSFGLPDENDPRFVANSIYIDKNKMDLTKGVFTVCKKEDDKCPPWALKAKKITHDKIKKTIYYKKATLKVYDIPVFYFPTFFHPDPTVKRQSGFLTPFITNSKNIGGGLAIPYYWMINDDKDITFTPKIYNEENLLILNEYRQAFQNGFLTLDSSFTQGYKNTSDTKTSGSRSHLFADLQLNLNKDSSYKSSFSIKTQKVSNDTYFRIHDINTSLVDSENTNLANEMKYSLAKDDSYFNIDIAAYENLREKSNSRYEYILPNILYGKTFFTEKFGALNFKSNAFHNNYDVNKYKTFLTNDISWNPSSYITKKGFVNTLEGIVRNTNYKTEKTEKFKNDDTQNEISGAIAYKSSLPLKKDGENYSNLFSPNFMIRFAPAHMTDMSTDKLSLNYTNLYTLNKTSEIEDGLSAILGFDFKIKEKIRRNEEKEKFSIGLGQVFNLEKNEDMPSSSSLDQTMSDVVGKINYNFSEIGKIDYKFSLDHNLQDLNYNEISTELNLGRAKFNLGYLEEQNHIGLEHYVSSGVSLNFNEHNKLSFNTKKNFKTDSTEFYNFAYQYGIDCLTAGLVYRREFYEDKDLQPNNTLMFTVTFVPFATLNLPGPK
jgi:LPS-assembly protein